MNILSFDIEEWFHLLDNPACRSEEQWAGRASRIDRNVDRILDLLAERSQRATFFCLGWVARSYPGVVRRIVAAGHELASHSDRHQLAYEQSQAEFREDLLRSVDSIAQVSGERVRAYRAPGFSVTEANRWVFDELLAAGIEVDCSIFPASRAHGGFPSFGQERPTRVELDGGSLREFPINTVRVGGRRLVFSGGGYFRLMPYPLLRRFTRRSPYVMTYFHPRDFDPGQPIMEGLSPLRVFKSYYGLRRAARKLSRYLDDVPWMTLSEAEAQVDWAKAPVVDLRRNHLS